MASSDVCDCPIDEINDIPVTDCEKTIGVIRKMAFCRLKNFQGVIVPATVTTLKDLAEWVDTLAAADDTKTVITDFVDNVVGAPGDFNTETVSQNEVINGKQPTTINFSMVGAEADTIAAMQQIACEGSLYVWFFNDAGFIIHQLDGTIPTGFRVEKKTFGLQDKSFDGNSTDSEKNLGQFQLQRNWSSNYEVTKPSFDPLEDLSNSGS